MQGLTQYITQAQWADILLVSFVYIDDAYQALPEPARPTRRQGLAWEPEFSDSEVVITITLFGEMVFHGAEDKTLHSIRQHQQALFPNLLDNSRFNRRKRHLLETMEAIRLQLRHRWRQAHPLPADEVALRIVDSAPIPLCIYTRAHRCATIAVEQRSEWFGVCISKK